MAGTLYIVATPIGNLEDLSPRAAATLGMVDFIAAEDTRVTLRLLNHLGLKKPMLSYYQHNFSKGDQILARLEAGENCALCSDAGMPAISDPGELLVKDALARNIPVCPIPGPSASVSALAVSGQDTARWVFEGFLPVQKKPRRQRLDVLAREERTILLYEAPHKLVNTLEDLVQTLGPDRSVTLCRELTKLHEEIRKTTLGQALEEYRETPPRGEFVLVVAGAAPAAAGEDMTLDQAVALARELMDRGQSASAAAKAAASGSPFSKGQIYKELIQE